MPNRHICAIAMLLAICAALAPHARAGLAIVVSAPYAPPPLRVEDHRIAPFRDAVWIDGRWAWRDSRYVWVGGHWEHRHPGSHDWKPGAWQQQDSMWVWSPGRWF